MTDADPSVVKFIDEISHQVRRRDAATLLELMGRATGEEARLWGSIVGFGAYHYRYSSGREGDAPAASFSPRKASMSIYFPDGIEAHADALDRLGPHTTGVGCLYVKDLEEIDLGVLEAMVARSFSTLTAATFTARARDGGRRE